jgi:hypothetical protein
VPRDPRAARLLGLWTAAWLFAFLLGGLLRVGNLALQWPVLLVPVLWALVALRPRRRSRPPEPADPFPLPGRTDTVARPALRRPDRDGRP